MKLPYQHNGLGQTLHRVGRFQRQQVPQVECPRLRNAGICVLPAAPLLLPHPVESPTTTTTTTMSSIPSPAHLQPRTTLRVPSSHYQTAILFLPAPPLLSTPPILLHNGSSTALHKPPSRLTTAQSQSYILAFGVESGSMCSNISSTVR